MHKLCCWLNNGYVVVVDGVGKNSYNSDDDDGDDSNGNVDSSNGGNGDDGIAAARLHLSKTCTVFVVVLLLK